MKECLFHINCGGLCTTPEQVAAGLCIACHEEAVMVRQRTDAIVDAATDLLEALDAAANVEEPYPHTRELMERLRVALAA